MANPWSIFQQDILARVPRKIGLVQAHNSDGTSTVQLPEGGTLNIHGQDVAVDAWCFIRDGEVMDGPAQAYGEILMIEI
jgi:hypothetical protein